MAHRLVLDDVRIALGGSELVHISAEIGPGEVLTVMGPSGAGKSSLLTYLAGFLDRAFTATGAVRLDGVRIDGLPPEQRRLGLLVQDPLLFPHLSVLGNLLFGVPRSAVDRRRRASEALTAAGLAGFEARDPFTLSGGQKARVAILRVLLADPHALLLDEPFSKLDVPLRAEIRTFVLERARARGLPMLLVTHDPADAAAAGGSVLGLGETARRP